MDPKDIRVTVSTNTCCTNKTRHQGEHEQWQNVALPLGDLINEFVRKGYAFCPSLFRGGYRSGANAFGGDTVVIDEDEGIDPAVIAELPVFKAFGIAIWPSASSSVTAEKKGVDGQVRSRVLFRVGRSFNTGKPTTAIALERSAVHVERIAVSEYIYDRFCRELGIEGLQDDCGKTVGQLMYGNDGKTPVEFQRDDGTKSTYPCSTDSWLYLNDGCMPVDLMDQLIADFREQQGERLKPKARRTEEENEQDYQLALWILENDVLSEEVLTDRESWTKVGMACRGISDDLKEPWLATCSRFDDGHYWRAWSYMEQNWERFSETSAIGIGTLIHYANESDKQWRYLCPFMGKTQKQFISPCFQLLRSHKPGTPGFFNFSLTGYES